MVSKYGPALSLGSKNYISDVSMNCCLLCTCQLLVVCMFQVLNWRTKYANQSSANVLHTSIVNIMCSRNNVLQIRFESTNAIRLTSSPDKWIGRELPHYLQTIREALRPPHCQYIYNSLFSYKANTIHCGLWWG